MGRRANSRSRKSMRASMAAFCATCFLSLTVWATPALGTTVNYWGYGNLTANNPPAGNCPGSAKGIACSGWDYWDYSRVAWTSGRSAFAFGFICQSDGLLWGRPLSGQESFDTYTVLWSSYCPTHYNRVAVAHLAGGQGTYNYLQARALIF